MTLQSDSTRKKISSILEQVGMTDEELYQLLYGKKQQVEIDISLPQLMDEEIWLETEHSEEELVHISKQLSALEQIIANPPEGATLEALEALLEGELIADADRGFLLRKYMKNWRKGMSQFLAFLAFSQLQQLALALASISAPHLLSQFEQTKSRPQDRRLLADFILQQIEQPLPPVIALLAEKGAILGATGSLEFKQPLTAALLQQSHEQIAQMLKLLEATPLAETEKETPAELSKPSNAQGKNDKTAALLNKLIVLDRVENLIANQQALQQPSQPQQATDVSQQQQDQPQSTSRRSRNNRRALLLREAMDREAREKTATARADAQTALKNDSTKRANNRQ